jgi:cysteine synthase A
MSSSHAPAAAPGRSDGFCGTVGSTPLIEIASLSSATGCRILGKAEFLNPGGSVKDRAALGIILDAEAKGLLQRGATIVEGTAGNTGIGLAHVANARGYRTVIVIPDTQSPEKMDYLRALGAEVRPVPYAPYTDPGNYNHVARRLAESIPGAFWADQFDNVANRDFHVRTTGPELWAQTGGRIDGFVSAVGTGGTLAGVARFLKGESPRIRVALADPHGASIYSWVKYGKLVAEGTSITEGIGQARVTKNLEGAPIDDAYRFDDRVIVGMVHQMLEREGLFLGSSSGINLCGAYVLARLLGPGHTVVTILCDGGARYLSRLRNQAWLEEKKLTPVPTGGELLALLDGFAAAARG